MLTILQEELGQGESFQEDLLEEQRPRLTPMKKYAVIILSIPTEKIILPQEEGIVQVSFIVKERMIISITTKEVKFIDKIMDKLMSKVWEEISTTSVFYSIMDEIVENIIDVIELLEKNIDSIKFDIMKNKDPKKVLQRVEGVRENVFYAGKMLRADLEVIRELIQGKIGFFDAHGFPEHIEDRMLYAIDLVGTARDTVYGLDGVYLAVLSHRLNEHIYKLTIVGAMLVVPTIIAGFWGMNVELPLRNFWLVVGMSIALSIIFAVVLIFMRKM